MATFGTYVSGQILTAAELNAGLPLCVLEALNTTMTDGVAGVVAFTTEVVDPLGWHSNVTNTSRITPNIAGTYLFNICVNDITAGGITRALVGLQKNGVPLSIPPQFDTTGIFDDFTISGYAIANGTTDYFEVRYLVTGATQTDVDVQFSAQRVAS